MKILNIFLIVALSLILLSSCATYRSNFDPKLIEIIDDIIDNPDQLRNYYDYHPHLKFKDSVYDFTNVADNLEKTILRIKELNTSWQPYKFYKIGKNKDFINSFKSAYQINDNELLGTEIISIVIKKSRYGYGVEFTFLKKNNDYKLTNVLGIVIF